MNDRATILPTTDGSDDMIRMTVAYIGPNMAHQRFVQKMTNEKVFIFLLMKNKESLLLTFQDSIEKARESSRQMGSMEFAIGVVTGVISPTQFKGISIRANESNFVAKDFAEFEFQVYSKSHAEVHRIFVDYQIDLYRDISARGLAKGVRDLSYKDNRQEAFRDIGLRMLPDKETGGATPEVLRIRLNELETTRHLLEHNCGIVDERFLRRNPATSLRLGERISIGPEQVGEAIALVETLAEDLNKRALAMYQSRRVG